MNEIPTPAPESWAAPPPQASSLRKVPRRALTITVATAALVLGAGAVLAAAAQSNGTSPSPTPAGGQMAPGGPMGNGSGQRMAGPMQALHGEYVVSNGSGGYSTEEMQRGSVTAVNGTTFTVKSDDGYTHDWVTDANTKLGMDRGVNSTSSGLTTGQNVMVMGTKDGDTFHAVRVAQVRQFNRNGQNRPEGGTAQAAPQAGQQQNGQQGFGPMQGRGGRGQFGHRFGGMPNNQNGPMQSGPMTMPMPQNGTSAVPSPDGAPDASPTPTQAS